MKTHSCIIFNSSLSVQVQFLSIKPKRNGEIECGDEETNDRDDDDNNKRFHNENPKRKKEEEKKNQQQKNISIHFANGRSK